MLTSSKWQNEAVTQMWTWRLSFMQQTVLLTAVRGPDGLGKYHPNKYLLRWFRRCTLLCALEKTPIDTPYDPRGGSFTGPSYTPTLAGNGEFAAHDWRDNMDKIFANYLKSLDEVPHHFQLHFMHAVEILGYKHPDEMIRNWWLKVYHELARDMHLEPEPEWKLDKRLGDNEDDWRAANHEATQT